MFYEELNISILLNLASNSCMGFPRKWQIHELSFNMKLVTVLEASKENIALHLSILCNSFYPVVSYIPDVNAWKSCKVIPTLQSKTKDLKEREQVFLILRRWCHSCMLQVHFGICQLHLQIPWEQAHSYRGTAPQCLLGSPKNLCPKRICKN